jgi:hypothetical protein
MRIPFNSVFQLTPEGKYLVLREILFGGQMLAGGFRLPSDFRFQTFRLSDAIGKDLEGIERPQGYLDIIAVYKDAPHPQLSPQNSSSPQTGNESPGGQNQ